MYIKPSCGMMSLKNGTTSSVAGVSLPMAYIVKAAASAGGDQQVDDCLALVWRISTLTDPSSARVDELDPPYPADEPPADLMRVGASATTIIHSDGDC